MDPSSHEFLSQSDDLANILTAGGKIVGVAPPLPPPPTFFVRVYKMQAYTHIIIFYTNVFPHTLSPFLLHNSLT
jgi:hypothetical protein